MAKKSTETPSAEPIKEDVKKSKRGGIILKAVVILIILGLAGAVVYYYKQYKKIKDNPQVISQEETQFVISEVGKIMELPGDETPSLATVQDKEKLKDQTFFRKAENGDKLLIYANAKQAILYRPSVKKIIEVAPLLIQGDENTAGIVPSQNEQSVEQTQPAAVEENNQSNANGGEDSTEQ
jgi:hypothetical protein